MGRSEGVRKQYQLSHVEIDIVSRPGIRRPKRVSPITSHSFFDLFNDKKPMSRLNKRSEGGRLHVFRELNIFSQTTTESIQKYILCSGTVHMLEDCHMTD